MSKTKAPAPCPIRPLDPVLVDFHIQAQGNRSTSIVYVKVDGTIGEGNGLPKVYIRRVGSEQGQKQAARMADTGQRFFDFPKPKVSESGREIPGFSFFNDRVLEIRAGSTVIRAKGYTPDMLAQALADKAAKKVEQSRMQNG